jgi:hypothetical protein
MKQVKDRSVIRVLLGCILVLSSLIGQSDASEYAWDKSPMTNNFLLLSEDCFINGQFVVNLINPLMYMDNMKMTNLIAEI